jgi:hypothetical protein
MNQVCEIKDGVKVCREAAETSKQVVYNTAQAVRKNPLALLAASIVIDIIGIITYFVPGLGELFDLGWAPISGFLVYMLYGSAFFGIANALEELLPFTDFIPAATLAWLYYKFIKKEF